jgi:hypothetical protein
MTGPDMEAEIEKLASGLGRFSPSLVGKHLRRRQLCSAKKSRPFELSHTFYAATFSSRYS